MRAVLDTNIFVSALLILGSIPRLILDAWRNREFEVVVTPDLLAELGSVLLRPRLLNRGAYTQKDVAHLLHELRENGMFCIPKKHHETMIVDPSDNFLFDAAVEVHANYIVTGDRRVLHLGDYKGITEIVDPRRFASVLEVRRLKKTRRKAA